MAKQVLEARIRQKTDTLANWENNELVLLGGEQAFILNEDGTPVNFRIGDGTKTFAQLPNWIAYDQAAYSKVTGTILPASDGQVHYTILGAGTYTQTGGANVVIPAGSLGIVSDNGTTWSVDSVITLPTIAAVDEYGTSTTAPISQAKATETNTKVSTLEEQVPNKLDKGSYLGNANDLNNDIDSVRELIIESEEIIEQITTPIAAGSVLQYNTGARRIADRSLTWQAGDRLRTLNLPINAGSPPTQATILHIYNSGSAVRQYDLGVQPIGTNVIDLYALNIVLAEGEEPVLQRLSYNGNITVNNRFYDLVTATFVVNPYYFSFVFDRFEGIEETNRIEKLEENVDTEVATSISFSSNSEGKLISTVQKKNLKSEVITSSVSEVPTATNTANGAMSLQDKSKLDDINDLLYYQETQVIDTPMLPYTQIFGNYTRRMVDRSIVWQTGDKVLSVTVPFINAPTSATTLFLYNANNTVKTTLELGTLTAGENIVDLSSYNITMLSGEFFAIRGVGYNNGVSIPADRFFDIASNTFLAFPYYFSFKFERTIDTNKFDAINEELDNQALEIEDIKQNGTLQTQGKVFLLFADSSGADSDWPQKIIEQLGFSTDSRNMSASGYTYETRYDGGGAMVSCLRLLIQQFETSNPTTIPDLIMINMGGNDYWRYVEDNSRLGTLEGAFSNPNYLALDDTLIYNAIRRNLEYLKRKYPTSTILVGTPFQVAQYSRKIMADVVKEVCERLSIKVFEGNKEVGISQYLETSIPFYTDNPNSTTTATKEYPRYNWVEPDGTIVTVAAKTPNAVKRYGLYTYDGTHQNPERGRQRVLEYIKTVILSFYRP